MFVGRFTGENNAESGCRADAIWRNFICSAVRVNVSMGNEATRIAAEVYLMISVSIVCDQRT